MQQNNGINGRRKVFLVFAHPSLASGIFDGKDTPDINFWMYLGRDVTCCNAIHTIIDSRSKRVAIADRVQELAKIHYYDYIEFIGKMSEGLDPKTWLLSSISEKSPFISNIFLYFCYCRFVVEFLENEQGNVCIFCESRALMATVSRQVSSDRHLHVQIIDSPLIIGKSKLFAIKDEFISKTWFVIRYTARIFCARMMSLTRTKIQPLNISDLPGKTLLIHSWADIRSFPADSVYNDVYFGDFASLFQKNGYNTSYIINILPTESYYKTVKKIFSTHEKFFLFEEFLSIFDPWVAILAAGKQNKLPIHEGTLGNIDLSDCIKEELLTSSRLSRPAQSFLYYCAGKRVSRKIGFTHLMFSFENQSWEKLLSTGLREDGNTPIIIGYAHSVVNKMELFYSVSSKEKASVPLPDLIVVNGKKSRDVLIDAGFDKDRICITGVFRKFSLGISSDRKTTVQERTILVALSVDNFRSAELILKAIRAYRDMKNIVVVIKPHPTMKKSQTPPFFSDMPSFFKIRREPISVLLDSADLVLFSDSTVAIEALAHKIPVLAVCSDFEFDMDIFGKYYQIRSARTLQQIRDATNDLFSSQASRSVLNFQDHISDYFEQPDEKRLVAFFGMIEKLP